MQNTAVNSAGGEFGQAADVLFCKNCKKNIAAGNFTVHEVHCVRNFTLCPHCDDTVAKRDIDHHVAEQHTKVTCPHCSALLMRCQVDQHVADLHATEPCPECGKDISKNLLEDHKRSVHSTTVCQLCHMVIDKTDLHKHQATDCAKRQVSCQYCNMMLAYSELTGHEDYCGSRTEPCVMCDRYIMFREIEAHRLTNCEYPFVGQKNETQSSPVGAVPGFNWNGERDFGHHFGGPRGYSILHHDLPERMLEMPILSSHLQDVFRPMVLRDIRHEDSKSEDHLFGVKLRQPNDDPPPPYHLYGNNTGDAHASDRPVMREERISPDDSDYDDEGVTLPCEFCKKLYIARKLLEHQSACLLSYTANNDIDVSHSVPQRLPLKSDDFQHPSELKTNNHATSEADRTVSSSLPVVVPDDSPSLIKAEQLWTKDSVITESDHGPVYEDTDAASSHQHSMIPCEFCLDLFDELMVTEHQDVCYRQQTTTLQAILDAGNNETADAATRYRYPYSVMTLEDRERLGQ